MMVSCACGVHFIEMDGATYIRDGHPVCNERTCERVRFYESQGYQHAPLASAEEMNLAAG